MPPDVPSNRWVGHPAGKRPVLADLRDSAAVEQESDVVWFIDRDGTYRPGLRRPGTAEIVVAKHRNGPAGMVGVAFIKHLTRFAGLAGGGMGNP